MQRRYYANVSAASNSTNDYTIPNGDRLVITKIIGNASASCCAKCELIWDATGTPEILMSTHGDTLHEFKDGLELIGDGSKVLRIKLTNDSDTSETMGVYYEGILYG